MADISFSCSQCGKNLVIEETGAGLAIQCPNCNATLTVPAPSQEKQCPFCAEVVKKEAIVCKHCGRDLVAKPPPVSTTAKPRVQAPGAQRLRYVSKNLNPNEYVVYYTRLHWMIFLGFGNILYLIVWILLWPLIPIFLLVALISYLTSEFAVTNQRVLIKIGWLRRKSLELLLTKVESIQVEQGLLGRIVNNGTIVITGTGGTKEQFKNIRAPFEFRKQLQQQADSVQGMALLV